MGGNYETGAFVTVWLGLLAQTAAAQLATDWVIPAVAHTGGQRGTFWRSDVSLHNPHSYDLPVVVQLLPSTTANWEAPTLTLNLYPYETVNLWDALGPDVFDFAGTGALLTYADTSLACDPVSSCQFLVTSRTYTVDPWRAVGEFGQTIPGVDVWNGVDWQHYGYAAGILNDGAAFRCNVGVASWTPGWTTVRVDVQHSDGTILATTSSRSRPTGTCSNACPPRSREEAWSSTSWMVLTRPSCSPTRPWSTRIRATPASPRATCPWWVSMWPRAVSVRCVPSLRDSGTPGPRRSEKRRAKRAEMAFRCLAAEGLSRYRRAVRCHPARIAHSRGSAD